MAISSPSIDPQSIGWIDDGTEQGYLRSANIGSLGMVRRAIRLGSSSAAGFRYEASGGASVANSLRTLRDSRYGGHYVTVTCPAADASYVKIQTQAYGRKIGLSWYYVSGQSTVPFSVVIDGCAYQVDFEQVNYLTQVGVTQVDPLLQWICPQLLDDKAHQIEIIFVGDQTSGSSRSWVLFDLLLDASAGYKEQMPTFPVYGPYSIPKATLTGTTISAAAADDSFNDSANGFVAAGFTVGDIITTAGFTGSAANNGTWKIATLAAGKITVTLPSGAPASAITDDAAGESVTIENTSAYVFTTGPWDTQNIRIMKVMAYNTTGGAVRWNLHHGDASPDNIAYSKELAAYESEIVNFEPYGYMQANLFVSASAAASIRLHVIAGQL